MKSSITSTKRIVKKFLLDIGIVRPDSKGRHGLVGNVALAEMKRDFQIGFLKNHGLLPKHTLLDLGCGTLRGGIPIIAYLNEGNYYGVDVRSRVISEARKELREHRLEEKKPHLIDMNGFQENYRNTRLDFVWAFSVLIHMHDAILQETMKLVADHLTGNGIFYANVNIGKEEEREWQGFPAVTRPLNFYEREARRNKLKVQVLGSLESLGHVSGSGRQDEQIMLKITPNDNEQSRTR